jgi:hypothetical protein
MESKRFIYYQEGELLVGWLEEYPDYRTQGETTDELKRNLQEIYNSPVDEWDESEWLHAAVFSPAFDFLRDPEEDIYFHDPSSTEVRSAVCLIESIASSPDFSRSDRSPRLGQPSPPVL